MCVPAILGSIAALVVAGAASADDVVAAFVGETVTVYDDAAAIEGRPVASCEFALPAQLLDGSQLLRVHIQGPEGPVWVSSSQVVLAGLDELPHARTVGAGEAMAGGTRAPTQTDAEAGPDGRSLPVGEGAGSPSSGVSSSSFGCQEAAGG